MSKLSFRARALDASKPLPIYLAQEIPENADCSLINRAVPQMPTGMEKEEESEHHLQRAICAGMVIPTPEVFNLDLAYYNTLYPENYKMPRQLIYMQPFSMEADIPDYDMDSDDENWVNMQAAKLELTPQKFEEMMDRLEKGSGQTVVTLQEAKALIKEDDDLIIAVYDYWLNKRLKTQHPLIPQVRTEARFGVSNHNPYIAFRRRTEKMQTRKNRKNDESSYEKMLKLKRDLSRAVTLLEMVKRREKFKRENLHLTIEVFEKRYQAGDFTGQIVNDALQQRPPRPAFTPLLQTNSIVCWGKDDPNYAALSKKEKRQYKKRRHKSSSKNQNLNTNASSSTSTLNYNTASLAYPEGEFASSDEDPAAPASPSEGDEEEEGAFTFRRKSECEYHMPTEGGWRRTMVDKAKINDRLIFTPTSITNNELTGHKYVGHTRRRFGRGGRMVLDRIPADRIKKFDMYSRQKALAISVNASRGAVDSLPQPANRLPQATPLNSVGHVPTPSTSTSANAYSNQQSHVHFRTKAPESQKPEEVSIDYSSEEDASEDKYEVHPYLFPMNPGGYLGAVVAQGDRPTVYSVASLLSETAVNTDPLPLHVANSPGESVILDDITASIANANYLTELNSGDLGLETSTWLSTIESMDTGNDSLDTLGSGSLHSLSVNQPDNTPNYSSSRPSSDPMDVDSDVVIVDSDGNSFEMERRRLIDKDNKENDSVSRDEVGDNSIISENGDGIEDSSEDCMIVEEPRSSVVNSSRGVSSSSTLLVDTIGMSGSDGHDVSNSLSKNLVDKSRTNSSNSQLLGSKNYSGAPTIIRRLYGKPRRTDGSNSITSKSDVLLKKGTVNGDADSSYSSKYNFSEVPLELLSGGEFIPDTDNNVETLEFGLGRSSKNLHLTVNSNTSSNNNSISMVTSSGPGPAKISLSNGPTVRSMPDCEQGSVVR